MAYTRVTLSSAAAAQRLITSIDVKFSASLDGDGLRRHVVGISVAAESAEKLVELFDALGNWLGEAKLTACQIGFGDRSYTLAAAADGQPNDATAFLLERTIQLQTALDSRIVLEQAKGILVERHGITTGEA